MTIGEKIRAIRTFRKMTMRELGLAMGFSETTADVRIAQYESNKRKPKQKLLIRMAEILEVNPANFISRGLIDDILQGYIWLDGLYHSEISEYLDELSEKTIDWGNGKITNDEYFDWCIRWTPYTVKEETQCN